MYAAPSAQLLQELVRRDKEGVLLKDAAEDDHRVCPHDVNDYVRAEFGKVVHADDRVLIVGRNVVEPRFVLEKVIHARSALQRPVHLGYETGQRASTLLAPFERLPEQVEHFVLIEATTRKIRVFPSVELQLTAFLCPGNIDAGRLESPDVFVTQPGVDDMECLVAPLEALSDKRKKHFVPFIKAVKNAQMWRCLPSVAPASRIGGSPDSALNSPLV